MQTHVEERDGGYDVAGMSLSLDSVVHTFHDGKSPEGILRSFPMAGPVVKIYGAITFYLENKEKIEAYLSDQEPALGRMTQGAAEVRRPSDNPSARS